MTPRTTPLLNIDLGERADEPEALYALAHIANIACGGHAGDAQSMKRALAYCVAHGTAAGAHPSYPDRAGFGRARLEMHPKDVRDAVAAQCDALADLAETSGVTVRHAKLHGALYHAANDDLALAGAVVEGVVESLGYEIAFLGPRNGTFAAACEQAGVLLLAEGFADRAVRPDGTLVPRTDSGALITDPAKAAARALELVRSGAYGTVCVHGDTPGAEQIARAVRDVLDRERA